MAEASKRSTPMEVLALGFPRTGTASMQAALQTLGYREVYHGFHMLDFPEDAIFWEKQVDAKFYGKGTGCGREDFDELLGKCAAITDMPCACFAQELLAAYPEVIDIRVMLVGGSNACLGKSDPGTTRPRCLVQELQRECNFSALLSTSRRDCKLDRTHDRQ